MAAINLEFRCYHAYKLKYTLFHMHFRFMVAIFDSPLTHRSDSILTSPVVLPASKPWALPLEFRCYRLYMQRYTFFRVHFRFMVTIFDFSLTQMSEIFKTCRTVLLDLKNVNIAVKIVSLACMQPGI